MLIAVAVSLYIVHEKLAGGSYHAILHNINIIPDRSRALAIILTIASYAVLTAYAILARDREQSLAKTAYGSFLDFAYGSMLRWPRRRILLLSQNVTTTQLAVATADWLLASAVLYVLLPHDNLPLLATAAAFFIAQVAGLISRVPGGFGVFDAVVLLLLSDYEKPTILVAALVAYRIIYYVLPFFFATASLLVYEAAQKQKGIVEFARVAGVWVPAAIPQALSIATFIMGTVLLLSGALPRGQTRIEQLHNLLPLGVIEASHFTGSIIGVGLLLLAWALQRRLIVAYHAASILLALAIPVSLLKGFDYEETALLAVLLLTMLPARRHFYRRASLTDEILTPGWIVAIVAVLGSVTWLGFFAYRHVEYRGELWWQFAIQGDAPRFLRATVGAGAVAAAFAAWRLFRPARPDPDPPTADQIERAAKIAQTSEDSAAQLVLLGDKRILFEENDRGFLMYGVAGRSWVALRDPVGDRETQRELAWQFRELVDKHGGVTVFYEVSRDRLDIYLDLGLTLLKLGEEARVDLSAFDLAKAGKAKKLRQTKRNVEKEGFTFDVVHADGVADIMPALRAISDEWLQKKNTREKSFSLGSFSEDYMRHFPIAVVRRDSSIVAFANVWEGAKKSELTVDLMRYNAQAPVSVMEYLFICMMLWAKENGYAEFNLGMAPFSGFHSRSLAPLWTRAGAFVYRYGEHFYNFRGLRDYKNKFEPVWVPRYIATPRGIVLPAALANVAALISGGYRGIVAK